MSPKQGSSVLRRRKHSLPKPLRGQSFYLDVPKKTRSNQLEEAILLLGGSLEPFLNKHVTCVVTDRPVMRRTSPRFQPSRGQIMLQNAKPLPTDISSSDVRRNANNWKIPIKTYDEFKEWLKERKAAGHTSVAKTSPKRKPRVRRLRGAFIKVEDRSRKYRPLIKEMRSWPRPNLDAKPGNGPFDHVTRTLRSSATLSPRRRRLFRKATLKKGYCELCGMEYEGFTKRHFESKSHKSEANRPGKYTQVDKLIDSGMSLKQFMEKLNKRQKIKPERQSTVKQPVTERRTTASTTPQTVLIRRSARLIAASLEGSAYFTFPATVTYTLPYHH